MFILARLPFEPLFLSVHLRRSSARVSERTIPASLTYPSCSVSLMINHGGNDALTGSSFKPCQCCSGIVSRKEKEDPAL